MKKVNLKPLSMNDLDNIMTWVNDPEVVGNFATLGEKITREQEKQYLEKILKSEDDKVYSIESEGGIYIGQIGLHEINPKNNSARYGILIGNKNYWGQGYAQSSIHSLLNIAFNELNLNKVWGVFLKTNQKAHHLNINKLGFKEEGILRDEYLRKGKYLDMVRVSMLQNEFQK